MAGIISVTDLCSFKFCERGLYIKKVLGFREPVKPVMVLGSIRHKVYDDANKKEEELISQITSDLKRNEVLQMFANAYNGILNKSIVSFSQQLRDLNMDLNEVTVNMHEAVASQAASRADEIISFSSKNNVFGEQLWQQLTPKIISELKVSSEKLRLKGVIDRIEDRGSEYVPVEIKTGRAPNEGVWPDHRLQLSAYAMLLREELKFNIKECLVKYVAADQTRQVVMNPFMEYEVTETVNSVFQLLGQNEIPDVCGKSYCIWLRTPIINR
ncbi:CRISPR-associated protein Cas4 [Candidatus Woesearchaeota archaeon]|nr:CRISPR-associated protein Cas4 [Candidatus Woesearchaeota archaeon]